MLVSTDNLTLSEVARLEASGYKVELDGDSAYACVTEESKHD